MRRSHDRRHQSDYTERCGECDRCGRWTLQIADGLCFGCHQAERSVQPVRVASDEARTPGGRWPILRDQDGNEALVLITTKRHLAQARKQSAIDEREAKARRRRADRNGS